MDFDSEDIAFWKQEADMILSSLEKGKK